MPLNPLDYLPLAAKAAQGLCRRCHAIAYEDAHGQALLELLLLIPRYDPARHPDPGKYLTWMLKRRLIDWARQGRHYHRPRQRRIPQEVPLPEFLLPLVHETPESPIQREDVIAHARKIVGEREWPIIQAILDDRPAKTAGPLLGVSESRVSQLRTALFARLKESSLQAFLEEQLCQTS